MVRAQVLNECNMYNLRVYVILIENNAVLLSDEYYNGMYITKFIGGGHEIGESLPNCLIREFKEELNLDIIIKSHFYTTDFYVQSFFNPNEQLISIYYIIELAKSSAINVSHKKFDFEPENNAQSLRWLPLTKLNEDEVTFTIDKKVVSLLKKSYCIL